MDMFAVEIYNKIGYNKIIMSDQRTSKADKIPMGTKTLYRLFNQSLPKELRSEFRNALQTETERHPTTIYDWIKGQTQPSKAEQKVIVELLNKWLPETEPRVTVEEIFN